MSDNFISLRSYLDSGKAESFLRLMKQVDMAMMDYYRDGFTIVDVNLDQIKVNVDTGKIMFPASNTFDPYEKTIASSMTGISLTADRKSSHEHNQVSFALMILGWYVSDDRSAVKTDIDVAENFDTYMTKVPSWTIPMFTDKFKKFNNGESFANYYNRQFVSKINDDLKNKFDGLGLDENVISKCSQMVVHNINDDIKKSLVDGNISKQSLIGFYEQYVLDRFDVILDKVITPIRDELQGQEETYDANNDQSNSLSKQLVRVKTSLGFADYNDNYEETLEIPRQVSSYKMNEKIADDQKSAFANAMVLVLILALIFLVTVACIVIFPKVF